MSTPAAAAVTETTLGTEAGAWPGHVAVAMATSQGHWTHRATIGVRTGGNR
jgi:hypothetical protein